MSGRTGLTVTMRLVAGLLFFVASGCALVGPPIDRPEAAPVSRPDVVAGPPIEPGGEEEALNALAADLIVRGEAALRAGDLSRARAFASEVIRRYPRAQGSSQALWVEGEAARLSGDRVASVVALFRIPVTADGDLQRRALELARTLANDLADPELRDLLDEAPSHAWLLPPFQLAYAGRRASVGDVEGAREWAQAAVRMQGDSVEVEAATELLRTLSDEVEAQPLTRGDRVFPGITLGLVLSEEGSPGLAQLSREIRAGVEVALLSEDVRGRVQLVVLEDAGDPMRASRVLAGLERAPVAGLLGPLTDETLRGGLSGRSEAFPIVSPTARLTPQGTADVYSIGGVDPEAARVLADLIWRDGVTEVAVFHRQDTEEEFEFRTFREAFEAQGGRVRQVFSYLPGATTFEEPMQGLRRAAPAAVVLFTPPEDAELVAPQLSFYEVDELPDLQLYGGSGWASRGVLELVPARHTEGLRTVAAHIGEGFGPDWRTFVETYEAHFQRSLRSPAAALGWDATRLLLEAARLGDGSPAGISRGLQEIRGIDGATGHFLWIEGRISRRFYPVEIRDRQLYLLDR